MVFRTAAKPDWDMVGIYVNSTILWLILIRTNRKQWYASTTPSVPFFFACLLSKDPDDNGNGIADASELDTDGDGIPDYLDEDDDGDGIADSEGNRYSPK